MINIDKYVTLKEGISTLIVCNTTNIEKSLATYSSQDTAAYVLNQWTENHVDFFSFNTLGTFLIVAIVEEKDISYKATEQYRKLGGRMLKFCDKQNIKDLQVVSLCSIDYMEGFIEGMLMASYVFDNYITDAKRTIHPFDNLHLVNSDISIKAIEQLRIIALAMEKARDLVNQTPSVITAETLASSFETMCQEAGIEIEVWHKEKIQQEEMGGILAVNQGSVNPPTFSIMEYKPQKSNNAHPIVLVGKGITYDTGGLNLKPGDYMDDMKSDMAGGATMAAALYAIAMLKLPIHVICLIPATDNRPNGNAYCSGDIVNMYDGTNVEVLNTDAEGRMILADALAYAKKLNPSLVVDMATLTGAAERAIGPYGIVGMEKDAENFMQALVSSGKRVYERIAEFPFWDEYDKLIVSDIADIKNSGEKFAGMITAGKFLAYFTSYPYIHLDIAGVAMNDTASDMDYSIKGATATGLRLIVNFLKTYYK